MTKLLNYRKILLSAVMIAFAASLVFAGTTAFFSDTETSTGNTFTAGAIDLKIDNSSYGFDWNDPEANDPVGEWGPNTNNSWQLSDLTDELFFSFIDLKPGDYGEDTISLHVNDNDAWACMAFNLTATPENDQTEPEEGVDPTDGADEGELQNYLSFLFWYDDGDNVLEDDEEVIEELSGLPGEIFSGDWLAIADTENQDTPLEGGTTHYIGKGWCFGAITEDPVTQDNASSTPPSAPDRIGFTCDGSGDHNDAQTDGIMVDVSFYAEQSRNNDAFLCSSLDPLGGGRPVGADLAAYTPVQGDSCDITVDDSGGADHTTIQAAIDVASPDQTICVADGTYDEDVEIDVEGLTLSGDGATATSIINGQATGQGTAVKIAADNVTVEGFQINGAGIAAVWLNTGVSGAEVRHNQITSANGATAITTQGSQSNNAFRNNVLIGNDSTQIAYVNGDVSLGGGQESDNVDFFLNTFSGTIVSGGVAMGTESTTANFQNNVVEDTISSTYAHVEFWKDDAQVNGNNFNGASAEIKVLNNDPDQNDLDAENNWWGDTDASDNVGGAVDFDPEAGSAFPEN